MIKSLLEIPAKIKDFYTVQVESTAATVADTAANTAHAASEEVDASAIEQTMMATEAERAAEVQEMMAEEADIVANGKHAASELANEGAIKKKTTAINGSRIAMSLALITIAAATYALYKLATAQEEIAKRAKESAEKYNTFKSSLSEYQKKIEELRKISDDNTKSVEEQQSAREDLLKIQSQMVEQFGDEAAKVDVLRDSVYQLNDAFDKLSKKEYQEFLNNVNKDDFWGKALKGWQKFVKKITGDEDYVNTNMEDIVYKMEHYAPYIEIDIDDRNVLEQLQEDFNDIGAGIDSNWYTGTMYAKNGSVNPQDYYESLIELQKKYIGKEDEISKKINQILTDEINKVKEVLDAYSDTYTIELENKVIYPKYGEQVQEIKDAINELNEAKSGNNDKEIEIASKHLAEVYNNVYKMIDDEASKNWFENLISDYQNIIDKQNFIIKIQPEYKPTSADDLSLQKIYNNLKDDNISHKNNYTSEEIQKIAETYTDEQIWAITDEDKRRIVQGIKWIEKNFNVSIPFIIDEIGLQTGAEKQLRDKFHGLIDTLSDKDLATALTIPNAVNMSWGELKKAIHEVNKEMSDLTKSEMIDSLTDMTGGFDVLDEIYADIYDKESFDFTKLSKKNFKEAFAGLEDEYNEFIETVSSHPDDINAAQDAFNKLTEAYIMQQGILQGLTEENKDVAIGMLNVLGIANSEDLVNASLAKKQRLLAEENKFLASTNKELYEATESDIDAFIDEGNYSNTAAQEIYAFALEKRFANGIDINNPNDLTYLENMAEKAGVAKTKIAELAAAKARLKQAEFKLEEAEKELEIDNARAPGTITFVLDENLVIERDNAAAEVEKIANEIQEEVTNIEYKPIEVPIEYEGGDKTKDTIKKINEEAEKSDKLIDWIEIKIKRVQREITNLGKIVSSTYKSWGTRNNALASELEAVRKEISLQTSAYESYMQAANAIELSDNYKALVIAGGFNVEEIEDDVTREKIKKFQELYEKALACADAVQDLNEQIAQLAETKFNNVKSEFEGLISEIEHFTNMIDKAISKVETQGKIAGKSFYEAKINQTNSRMSQLQAEREALVDALANAEANGIEVGSEAWVNMRNQIYNVDEAIADCELTLEELKQKIKEVAMLNFNDLKKQFEDVISLLKSQISLTDNVISMVEKTGHIASEQYYKNLIEGSKANVTALRQEYERLTSELSAAMASGDITQYSPEWYEMSNAIANVKNELIDAANAVIDYTNALRQIQWDMFDRGVDAINKLVDETEFMIELLSYEDLFKDGEMTDAGMATQGLLVEKYQAYVDQAKAYGDEAAKIKKELEKDPKNTTLLDRYQELLAAQRQAIINSKKEQEAIKELAEKGYDSLLETIKKLIDEYKNALQAQKELYDYENTINEKTKTVNDLQKQIFAYSDSGNTTEENRATLQKLNADLIAAQKDLQETEYDKYISDQEKLLDEFYNDLEEWINSRLDDLDALLEDAINATNLNGAQIDETLHETSDSVNYTMTDEFTSIWDKYAEANSSNYDILSLTSATTSDMRLKMDELATEAGLEEFFTGEDLKLLEELTSVDSNTQAMNDAINIANAGLSQIQSNVVELDSSVDSAASQIVGAINAKDLSVSVNVNTSCGNTGTSTDISSSGGTNDAPSTQTDSVKTRYRIKGTDREFDSAQEAAAVANTLRSEQLNALEQARRNGMPQDDYNRQRQYIMGLYQVETVRYAKGGIIGKDDNILDIIAQSVGEDHMVAAKEGERILTPEQNESFEKMVNANFTPIDSDLQDKYSALSNALTSSVQGMLSTVDNIGNISTSDASNISNIGNNTTTIGDINISLPNVTDKQEFVSWLKNDGQIENIIQAMTIGKMTGGNSYAKMKF